MPRFQFTAINKAGKRFSDTKIARTVELLENSLAEQGAWLVKASETKDSSQSLGSEKSLRRLKAKRWDLINFFTQLSLLLNAGITLPNALNKLAKDMEEDPLGKAIALLHKDVVSGISLPESMQKMPRSFNNQMVALVRAGESSGNLPETMTRISSNLEWIDELLASAKQAVIYPLAILFAACGLVLLLMIVVVPKFKKIFDDLGMELPGITQVVLGFSDFFVSTWFLWIPAVSLIPIFFSLPRSYKRATIIRDTIIMKIPFFGEISRSLSLSQFCVTLEMLIRAGISLPNGLVLCSEQSTNVFLTTAIDKSRQSILEGSPMSEEMERHPIFTQMIITMVQTGEKSGQLDYALERVGDYYNTIIPRKIKAFFAFFEPALILSLTGVVGVVALALVLPILSLWNV